MRRSTAPLHSGRGEGDCDGPMPEATESVFVRGSENFVQCSRGSNSGMSEAEHEFSGLDVTFLRKPHSGGQGLVAACALVCSNLRTNEAGETTVKGHCRTNSTAQVHAETVLP